MGNADTDNTVQTNRVDVRPDAWGRKDRYVVDIVDTFEHEHQAIERALSQIGFAATADGEARSIYRSETSRSMIIVDYKHETAGRVPLILRRDPVPYDQVQNAIEELQNLNAVLQRTLGRYSEHL